MKTGEAAQNYCYQKNQNKKSIATGETYTIYYTFYGRDYFNYLYFFKIGEVSLYTPGWL
jgi:hypothetical protein